MNLPQGDPFDLAVLGGGIIGMACAFEQASRGKSVVVVDPNPLGHKASWAAAGILASRAGVLGSSDFREQYLRSIASYPEWLERISRVAGRTVTIQRSGDYQIFPLDQPASLRALGSREGQLEREKATAYTVLDELPPFLRGHSSLEKVRVFHFPEDGYVQNRILLEVLEAALRNLGVTFLPEQKIRSLQSGNETQISGDGWSLRAEQTLIAAGAWCNDILEPLGWTVPLSPVKGQLAWLPNFHGADSMVHCIERFYLVPRDGGLICGATTESGVGEDGFDSIGDGYLRDQLRRYFPQVEPHWVETWSGIRPRTRDRMPLMGWVDRDRKIALCSGHYKSGISLAPLAARCLSALLQGEKPPADLTSFDPHRRGGLTPYPPPALAAKRRKKTSRQKNFS